MRTQQDEQISEILDDIRDELENANSHNQVNLPWDFYNAVRHLVKEEDRVELMAKKWFLQILNVN